MPKPKYFLTVQRCSRGPRGILCDNHAAGYWKESQHTFEEMVELLGAFTIIFDPKSELFTEKDLKKTRTWHPLAEFKHQLGIAYVPEENNDGLR